MPYLLILLSLFILSGCSAKKIPLNLDYNNNETSSNIKVVDNRGMKDIIMKGVAFDGSLNYYFFEETPKMTNVIESNITSNLKNSSNTITVKIEYLDLLNKVGFAQNDDLYCTMKSSLKISNNNTILLEKEIQTSSFDNTNLSPFLFDSGKVILDKCLMQHSIEITKQINNINN